MTPVRLQKYLSQAGVCSRRRGEALIRAGRVAVNGKVVSRLGTRVDPEADRVAVDGRPVTPDRGKLYLVLNKPAGVVTSCDHPGERIVMDLVDLPQRVYPVGRLDKATTGLLLLTNDGRIHHRLSHPSFDHEKVYEVTVDRPIPDHALERLAGGMVLDGRPTRPARVSRRGGRRFRIVLKEGRNRQIRRMVRKVGHRVVALKRTRMAGIALGRLPEGSWRHLTPSEVGALLKTLEAGHQRRPGGRRAKG
jgi:pseudouridine synthase